MVLEQEVIVVVVWMVVYEVLVVGKPGDWPITPCPVFELMLRVALVVGRLTLSDVLVVGRVILVEGSPPRPELSETLSGVLEDGSDRTLGLDNAEEPLGRMFAVALTPAPIVPVRPRLKPSVALRLKPEELRPRPSPAFALTESETLAVTEACTFRIVLEEGPVRPTPPLTPAFGSPVTTATAHPFNMIPPFVQVLTGADTVLDGAPTPVTLTPAPKLPAGSAPAT